MAWGAAPTAVDLVLDVSRMVGVLTHAAGDLVVTVQPGLPLADLQAALTQRQGGEISLAHTVTVLDASIRGLTVASLTGG